VAFGRSRRASGARRGPSGARRDARRRLRRLRLDALDRRRPRPRSPARELYAIYLQLALRFGEVWMAEDASGAAAWTRSDTQAAQATTCTRKGSTPTSAGCSATVRGGAAAEELIAPHRSGEPHWRLEAVGVVPAAQGRGIGRKLVEPVLGRCDALRRPAALETSSADNVRLYRRLGFEVHHEVQVPSGPHVWLMRRAPRPVLA
jgi:GNAT superfamily N-acetyltransferase